MYGHAEDLKILGFLNFMRERTNGLDSYPHHHIKGGRSKRNGHTKGILSPDTSVEDVRGYLLDPKIYGLPRTPRKDFRGPGFRLPIDDLS